MAVDDRDTPAPRDAARRRAMAPHIDRDAEL